MTNLKHGGKPLDVILAYVDVRREAYPSLLKALALYGRIFCIQSRCHDLFQPDLPVDLGAEDGGRPVVFGPLPGLDVEMPLQALAEISEAVAAASPDRRSEIESARASCADDDALLRRSPGWDAHLSPSAQVLLLLALNPFYEKFARAVIPMVRDFEPVEPGKLPMFRDFGSVEPGKLDLPEIPKHRKHRAFGHCPVCGESPSVGCYETSTGARFAQCRLCRTQWPLGRVRCAFCGCEEADKLGYLQADDNGAHRVEVCDSCGRYLKTVDERALGSEAILHVEELLMSALDHEAAARGYASR